MMDWLASFGADLIRIAAIMLIAGLCMALTAKLLEWFAPNASENVVSIGGCALWFALLAASMVVFGPALDQLQRFACRDARDFDLCMNPPDPEYP